MDEKSAEPGKVVPMLQQLKHMKNVIEGLMGLVVMLGSLKLISMPLGKPNPPEWLMYLAILGMDTIFLGAFMWADSFTRSIRDSY